MTQPEKRKKGINYSASIYVIQNKIWNKNATNTNWLIHHRALLVMFLPAWLVSAKWKYLHKVKVLGLPVNTEKWDKILLNSIAFLGVIITNTAFLTHQLWVVN